MKHRLSFGQINLIAENIAEVIIDQGVEMTLEMVEEYDDFLSKTFSKDFGLLINKVNQYSYTYEAQLSIGSVKGIKALAVINYHQHGRNTTNELLAKRTMDNWNLKNFSGLELGWQQGLQWLKQQLAASCAK